MLTRCFLTLFVLLAASAARAQTPYSGHGA